MNLIEAEKELKNVPYLTRRHAEILRNVFIEHNVKNVLELGFSQGASTCYMAAILDELCSEEGKITTIDRELSKNKLPNIETNLKKLNLEKYVEIFYEHRSYIWRLHKFLEEKPLRQYDFCYIDGEHVWDTDGFAFFLVDRLLKPGGIVVFDDLTWTIASTLKSYPERRPKYAHLSEEEMATPQIGKVYDLLVCGHENYHNFKLLNNNYWGFAQKKS
ncbi:MAG: class I SAM-dependent methyltransferase [Candidatus Gastranaerophilales bacterium]|nr:class I SAM-dependent methyltransferase [Candidatus Gastranaerophilales bacterium]